MTYKKILDEIPDTFECDGCTAVPDWLPSVGNIYKVCRVHDWLYSIGGDKHDRKYADIVFRDGIFAHCKAFHAIPRAWLVATTYYIGVRIFGGRHFNWRKKS